MALELLRIDHVHVTVPRVAEAEALRFYGELLGLERIAKPAEAAKRGGAWFRRGTMQVHVGIDDVDVGAQGTSKRHVCYVVADLGAAREAFRLAHVAIQEDAHPEPGLRRFYVHDPGGNRVEIAEARPTPT
jgi:catechol 2,3-dioxygenase-like lactoylglutathione lyase family enzyme